jgi:hypothetical protein
MHINKVGNGMTAKRTWIFHQKQLFPALRTFCRVEPLIVMNRMPVMLATGIQT